MTLFTFMLIITLAGIVGIQMGIYAVLEQKRIDKSKAFYYSFSVYLMPLVMVITHIKLFRERHILFAELTKKTKIPADMIAEFNMLLDTKSYIVISLIGAIKDILTPRDNISVLLEAIVILNKKNTPVKTQRIISKEGSVGFAKLSVNYVSEKMKYHALEGAFEGTLLKKYAS
ncbi:hypothetical protein JNUCC23_09505 [Peribacillus sp. JNUCC 23]